MRWALRVWSFWPGLAELEIKPQDVMPAADWALGALRPFGGNIFGEGMDIKIIIKRLGTPNLTEIWVRNSYDFSVHFGELLFVSVKSSGIVPVPPRSEPSCQLAQLALRLFLLCGMGSAERHQALKDGQLPFGSIFAF